MHASFSIHHSSPTTSIHHTSMYIEFKSCDATNHHEYAHTYATIGLWACSPYLCAFKKFWSLSFVIFLPLKVDFISLCISRWISFLCTFLSPFVNNCHKRCQILIGQVNHERVSVWDQFYHFGSNQHNCISELLGLIQEQAFSHILQWLSCSCWLNTYGHAYDLNTRFASPQTCHMPPLDQYIIESNSGAIHASKTFDFSWMSLLNVEYD